MSNIWIFSNNRVGYYEDSDWDTSTILRHGRYYFKSNEPNRSKVAVGDQAILREYGTGIWGACEITGDWVDDPKAKSKCETPTNWTPAASWAGHRRRTNWTAAAGWTDNIAALS